MPCVTVVRTLFVVLSTRHRMGEKLVDSRLQPSHLRNRRWLKHALQTYRAEKRPFSLRMPDRVEDLSSHQSVALWCFYNNGLSTVQIDIFSVERHTDMLLCPINKYDVVYDWVGIDAFLDRPVDEYLQWLAKIRAAARTGVLTKPSAQNAEFIASKRYLNSFDTNCLFLPTIFVAKSDSGSGPLLAGAIRREVAAHAWHKFVCKIPFRSSGVGFRTFDANACAQDLNQYVASQAVSLAQSTSYLIVQRYSEAFRNAPEVRMYFGGLQFLYLVAVTEIGQHYSEAKLLQSNIYSERTLDKMKFTASNALQEIYAIMTRDDSAASLAPIFRVDCIVETSTMQNHRDDDDDAGTAIVLVNEIEDMGNIGLYPICCASVRDCEPDYIALIGKVVLNDVSDQTQTVCAAGSSIF